MQIDVLAQTPSGSGSPVTLSASSDVLTTGSPLSTGLPDVLGLVLFPNVTLPFGRATRLTLGSGTEEVSITVSVPATLSPAVRVRSVGASSGGPRRIELSATESFAPTGGTLGYLWTLISKPDWAQPFSAQGPSVAYDARRAGTYVFSVTVTVDGGRAVTQQIAVTVADARPVANAGADARFVLQRPGAGGSPTATVLALDGTASRSPNGNALAYFWALLKGPDGLATSDAVEILSPASARPGVQFSGATRTGTSDGPLEAVGTYVFRLTVSELQRAGSTSYTFTSVQLPASLADGDLIEVRIVDGTGKAVDGEAVVRCCSTGPSPSASPPRPGPRSSGRGRSSSRPECPGR